VRFYSTVDLVNALEQEKAQGKAGHIATALLSASPLAHDSIGTADQFQLGANIAATPQHLQACQEKSRPESLPIDFPFSRPGVSTRPSP